MYLSMYLNLIYDFTDRSSYSIQCCDGSYNAPRIDYIECSDNVYSLSQCSFHTSSLSEICSDLYNDLHVTCRRSKCLSIYLFMYLYLSIYLYKLSIILYI